MQENLLKKNFYKFVRLTTFLSVILLLVSFLLNYFFKDLPHSPARPWLILFFLAITNLVFYYQVKASINKSSRSVNVFIITTGFKLLFFLAIIIIYALIFRNDAANFIIDFFILYLIFMIVEVIQIRKFQNSIQKD